MFFVFFNNNFVKQAKTKRFRLFFLGGDCWKKVVDAYRVITYYRVSIHVLLLVDVYDVYFTACVLSEFIRLLCPWIQ